MLPTPFRAPERWVALSIKQPWAALVVAGLKTIEVRTWPATRRGWILIHASKIPDDRKEAWEALESPELLTAADLRGGIVGMAQLVDCRVYESARKFSFDRSLHHNLTAWFRPPRLFGLVFQDIRPVPFYPYPGKTMFFGVQGFVAKEMKGSLKRRVAASTLVLPPEGTRRRSIDAGTLRKD